MSNTKTYKSSFNGGEMSPDLYGRIDINKYQNGVALLRNFVAAPYGPAIKRGGTEFIRRTKDYASDLPARLLEFNFSYEQSLAIEMGDTVFRFHSDGATVLGSVANTLIANSEFGSSVTLWNTTTTNFVWSGATGQDGVAGVALYTGAHAAFDSYQAITTFFTNLKYSCHFAITADNAAPGATLKIRVYPQSAGPSAYVKEFQCFTNPIDKKLYSGQFYFEFDTPILEGFYRVSIELTPGSQWVSTNEVSIDFIRVGMQTSAGFLEVPHPYGSANLFDVQHAQSGDVMTLVHADHPPAELRRLDGNNWLYAPINFLSTIPVPDNQTCTGKHVTSTGTNELYMYLVTSINADGFQESSNGFRAAVNTSQPQRTVSGFTTVDPAVFTSTAHGYSDGDIIWPAYDWLTDAFYIIDNSTANTFQLTDGAGYPVSGVGQTSSASTVQLATITNDLNGAKNYNTIQWDAVAGATRYNIYKYKNGLWGYIGQTSGLKFKDDNILADYTKTLPLTDIDLSQPGYYPSTVCYHEQRRCFASSTDYPRNVWMTRTGSESDLTYSLPAQATDALRFKIAAQNASAIRHLVPMTDLIALTSANEWRIYTNSGDALSASTITIKPQTSNGASKVQPITANNFMLYPSSQSGHIREFAYNWQINGFQGNDICLLAPHLFDDLYVKDMAFSRSPFPVLWVVSSNGLLLGMTYVPEQQVAAWHVHEMSGWNANSTTESPLASSYVESVCVVSDPDETTVGRYTDTLYLIVNRPEGRCIERMRHKFTHTSGSTTTIYPWHFDSALVYSGASTTTISGLSHIIGETVGIFYEGKIQAEKVVGAGGTITLDTAVTNALIGIPFTAKIRTLPLAIQTPSFGQGMTKNPSRIFMKLSNSEAYGVICGPDEVNLSPLQVFGITNPLTTVPIKVTDEVNVFIMPTWNQQGQVYIESRTPYDLTITGITMEFAVGG